MKTQKNIARSNAKQATTMSKGQSKDITIIPRGGSIINPNNIPMELKNHDNWVLYDKTKQPYNPLKADLKVLAKPNDKSTWTSFDVAYRALQAHSELYTGLGFVFTKDCGLVAVDFDTMRDPESGELLECVRTSIDLLDSYTELSMSGYGFHVIVKAEIALNWNKQKLKNVNCPIIRPDIDPKNGKRRIKNNIPQNKIPEIEVYNNNRYFALTFNIFENRTLIHERQDQLQAFYNAYTSQRVDTRETSTLPLKSNARHLTGDFKDYLTIGLKKDTTFLKIWNGEARTGDESADDLALMNKLAYWCSCDNEAMANAFVKSPFYSQKDAGHRKKWQRNDYLTKTVSLAIRDCQRTASERDTEYKQKVPTQKQKRKLLKKSLEFMKTYNPNSVDYDMLEFDLNDSGNAERFLTYYGEMVRYCSEDSYWYIWNGKKWEKDHTGKIYKLAIKTAKTYKVSAEAKYIELDSDYKQYIKNMDEYLSKHDNKEPRDPKTFKSQLQHATSSGNMPQIERMLKNAEKVTGIRQDILDTYTHLLTCGNGTLNLKTSELQQYNTEHFITRMTDIEYTQNATAPLFESFLNRIFDNNTDLISYMQKVLGYCLTGETGEQCFFIGYGTGANGKSTLLNVVSNVIPEYCQTIATSELMHKDRSSNTTPELARAKGARIVIASESNDINRLNEGQIKQLTGSDVISVRPLWSQGFEYRPTFKIWLCTNHKPEIKGTDNGIWRRVHLIPFNVTIPEQEQDPDLNNKLIAESKGIFRWLVDGAKRFYTEGLQKPDIVKDATNEYRSEMDIIGAFLEDCTEAKEGGFISSASFYDIYEKWCKENSIEAIQKNPFTKQLNNRGLKAIRKYIGRGYENLKLSSKAEDLKYNAEFEETDEYNPFNQ